MKRAKIYLLSLLVLSLPASSFAGETPKTLKETLGAEAAAMIFSAETVGSYRLGSMNVSPAVMPSFGAGKYVAGSPGPSLTPPQIKTLQGLLDKALPYRSDPISNCRFNPGVALQFFKGGKSLNLLFCFSCDEWAFENQGKMVYAQFGSDRKALVALAKNLFPQDSEIQQLKP